MERSLKRSDCIQVYSGEEEEIKDTVEENLRGSD